MCVREKHPIHLARILSLQVLRNAGDFAKLRDEDDLLPSALVEVYEKRLLHVLDFYTVAILVEIRV